MEPSHLLFFQPVSQPTIEDWDHTFVTAVEKLGQILVTGNRVLRSVGLTAQGEEKCDHVLRFAMLALFHVDGYPSFDRIVSVKRGSRVRERLTGTRERTLLSRRVDRRHSNLCSALLTEGAQDEPVPCWGLE